MARLYIRWLHFAANLDICFWTNSSVEGGGMGAIVDASFLGSSADKLAFLRRGLVSSRRASKTAAISSLT